VWHIKSKNSKSNLWNVCYWKQKNNEKNSEL